MNRSLRRCLATAAAVGALAVADRAAAQDVCGTAYRHRTALDVAAAFGGHAPGTAHAWGVGNATPAPDGVVRVAFPQGSVNPGNKTVPSGGGGFEQTLAGHAEARCLRYEVRFQPGFDFAKGGKLPGLFGGDAPRGCSAAELSAGFSARLMWRTGGAGELYLYAPGRNTRCGDSIDRGAWRFTPGDWTAIAEEVAVNTPGQSDGRIRVWVDGRKVIERTDLMLREQSGPGVDGLLFATFFGGNDPSWASPKDQFVEFRRFEVWDNLAVP